MSDQFESLFPDRFKHDLHSPPVSEQDKARKLAEERAEQLLAEIFHSECSIEYAHMKTVEYLLQFAQERESEAVRELVDGLNAVLVAMKSDGRDVKFGDMTVLEAAINVAENLIAKHSRKGAK